MENTLNTSEIFWWIFLLIVVLIGLNLIDKKFMAITWLVLLLAWLLWTYFFWLSGFCNGMILSWLIAWGISWKRIL